jgi:hypothetical protein
VKFKVRIKAIIDQQQLIGLLRSAPVTATATPIAEFHCGPFQCDTIEDVWAIATEMVAQERQAAYEKLKDFAP